mgnify:CR=1 FL=1
MTEMNTANQQSTALIDPSNVFQPLALRAMFWRPTYLEVSAWLEHIPFAFWLIEAHRPKVVVELGSHYGASYFSFCQAVDRLELDTQCFAVDTWKGDEHAGVYDEKVFAKVKAHNDAHYSGFSRLVRSSFDDAQHHFSDGSIDLLHIDGLHTLEAVRHDFDNWLPKLSNRAVIIMHDTNVRERNFGVFKLFEQLQTQYPAFEFLHGHGLGVLGVGTQQNDLLKHLYQTNKNEAAKRAIQEVFSRLGRACADSFAAIQQQERANKLNEEVNKQKKQLEEVKLSLDKTKADLTNRSKDLNDTKSRLQTQIEHHAVERGQLAERATLYQELRAELKEEVVRLQATINSMSSDLYRRTEDVARLDRTNLEHQQQSDALAKDLQERDSRVTALVQQREKIQSELKAVQTRLTERDQEVLLAGKAPQAQSDALASEVKERDGRIAALTQQSEERQAKLTAVQTQLKKREEELVLARSTQQAQAEKTDTVAKQLRERDSKIATLSQQSEEAQTDLTAMRTQLIEGQHEITLARSVQQAHVEQLETLAKQLQERDSTIVAQKQKNEEWQIQLDGVHAQLMEREQELALACSSQQALADQCAALRDDVVQLEQEKARQQEQVAAMTVALQEVKGTVSGLNQQSEESQAELKAVHIQLTAREQELAVAYDSQQKQADLFRSLLDDIAKLEQEKVGQQLEVAAMTASLEERESIIVGLTQQSEDRLAEVKALQARLVEYETDNRSLSLAGDSHVKELAKLTQVLEATTEAQRHQVEQVGMLREELVAAEQVQVELKQAYAKAEEQQQAKLKAQEAQVQRLGTENGALQADKDKLAASVADRFKELAKLTQMLQAADNARKQHEDQATTLKKQLAGAAQTRADQKQEHAKAEEQQRAKLKAQEAEVQRMAKEKAVLQADKDKLALSVEDHAKKLAKLTQTLDVAYKAHKRQEDQAEILKKQLAAAEQTHLDLQHAQAVAQEQQQAKVEAHEAHEQVVKQLQSQLARKETELQSLAQRLAQNSTQQNASPEKSILPFRLFKPSIQQAGQSKDERKLAQQVQLLRQSGLFNEAWYLVRYPDVKRSNTDPIEHYLQFGAAEQRDPGPLFSTQAYTEAHPDVVESQINPLVHYINHGSKEGRIIQSAKES